MGYGLWIDFSYTRKKNRSFFFLFTESATFKNSEQNLLLVAVDSTVCYFIDKLLDIAAFTMKIFLNTHQRIGRKPRKCLFIPISTLYNLYSYF